MLRLLNNGQGISRNTGYRNAAGKEAQAKAVFNDFKSYYKLELKEITDKHLQITRGDWITNGNNYIECKSQNIGQYQRNFIEVGEYGTGNSIHNGGHTHTAEWLHSNGIDLSTCNINQRGYTKETQRFGNPSTYNPGITPLLNGADVFYINRTSTLIYYYRAERLQELIRNEIKSNKLYWGGGMSNETTIAVFVENSPIAWQKVNGSWKFLGSPELEQEVMAYLESR
jgi:hypothetical protein